MKAAVLTARFSVGALFMIGSAFFWAAGTVFSKGVLDNTDVSPLPLVAVQLAASVAVLWTVVAVSGRSTRGAWRLGWTGLLEPGAAYSLSIVGLALTSASNATVLGSLEPVVVPLLAWVVLQHRPRAVHVVLVTIATSGAIVVSMTGNDTPSGFVGDALVLGGVVAAALYVVLSSRHVAMQPPVVLAVVQQTWALGLTVALSVGATVLVAGTRWPESTPEYLAAAASGVCLYAIPFSLYLHALAHIPVTDAAIYLCLIPVFGIAGSFIALGEPITAPQVVGSLVVIAALYANTRTSTRDDAPTGSRADADADDGAAPVG
jgi:drug/metabolite transporter (DMT)-like permease